MQGGRSGLVLEVGGVSKAYGPVRALKNLHLAVRRGEISGLLGPNGSGKTTALHVITGIIPMTRGKIRIAGYTTGSQAAKRVLGFAPDDLPLPSHLTGMEYLQFHDRMRQRIDMKDALVLAEVFDLTMALNTSLADYSHGMKRKLQLVAATMHRPGLLILDEPYRGLDPEAVVTLRRIIATLVERGTGVLIATHDLSLAERECDRVTILDHGETAEAGVPSALTAEYSVRHLEDVFLAATGLSDLQQEREALVTNLFQEP